MGQPLVRQSPYPSLCPAPFFPGWAGRLLVWGLFQAPLLRPDLFPPFLPYPPVAPPGALSRGAAGCPRAPDRGHCGHHCHPFRPAGRPPRCPPHSAHLHLVRGQGRDSPGRVEGGIPDLGRLFPFPRSRPPTLLPIASFAGEVFPEGQRGVTFIDQGIPSVLEPVCVLVGALTPASLVPLPARHPLMGGAGGWGQIF